MEMFKDMLKLTRQAKGLKQGRAAPSLERASARGEIGPA
jgi:hypothetical protein